MTVVDKGKTIWLNFQGTSQSLDVPQNSMNNITPQFTSMLQLKVCSVIIISTNVLSVYLGEHNRKWLLSYDIVADTRHRMVPVSFSWRRVNLDLFKGWMFRIKCWVLFRSEFKCLVLKTNCLTFKLMLAFHSFTLKYMSQNFTYYAAYFTNV